MFVVTTVEIVLLFVLAVCSTFLRPVCFDFGEAGERVSRSCCGVLRTRHWVLKAVGGSSVLFHPTDCTTTTRNTCVVLLLILCIALRFTFSASLCCAGSLLLCFSASLLLCFSASLLLCFSSFCWKYSCTNLGRGIWSFLGLNFTNKLDQIEGDTRLYPLGICSAPIHRVPRVNRTE
jgi:hypothetical protein